MVFWSTISILERLELLGFGELLEPKNISEELYKEFELIPGVNEPLPLTDGSENSFHCLISAIVGSLHANQAGEKSSLMCCK